MVDSKIIIVPCSGIGKAVGSVTRKATYRIVDDLRSDTTTTICLALLTVGDEETKTLVKQNTCIAIDGCPSQCSKKNIEASGGNILAEFITTEILRANRGLKPQGVINLNEDGLKLTTRVVEKVLDVIDNHSSQPRG